MPNFLASEAELWLLATCLYAPSFFFPKVSNAIEETVALAAANTENTG